MKQSRICHVRMNCVLATNGTKHHADDAFAQYASPVSKMNVEHCSATDSKD
jgi:hypothetical protein